MSLTFHVVLVYLQGTALFGLDSVESINSDSSKAEFNQTLIHLKLNSNKTLIHLTLK